MADLKAEVGKLRSNGICHAVSSQQSVTQQNGIEPLHQHRRIIIIIIIITSSSMHALLKPPVPSPHTPNQMSTIPSHAIPCWSALCQYHQISDSKDTHQIRREKLFLRRTFSMEQSREITDTTRFKRHLKTVLFQRAFLDF